MLSEENKRLKAGWDGEKRRTRDLEIRLVNAESANNSLQRRAEAFNEAKVVLENEVCTVIYVKRKIYFHIVPTRSQSNLIH